MHILALQINGKIGVGTIITFVVVIAGMTWGYFKLQQGDPSEWRESYLGEVTKREQLEKERQAVLAELAVLRARTDLAALMDTLTKFEDRMTRRMDALDRSQKQHTEVLSALADSVRELVPNQSRRAA